MLFKVTLRFDLPEPLQFEDSAPPAVGCYIVLVVNADDFREAGSSAFEFARQQMQERDHWTIPARSISHAEMLTIAWADLEDIREQIPDPDAEGVLFSTGRLYFPATPPRKWWRFWK